MEQWFQVKFPVKVKHIIVYLTQWFQINMNFMIKLRIEIFWANELHQVNFCRRRRTFMNFIYFGLISLKKLIYSEKQEEDFSGAKFRFSFLALSWSCLISCNITRLEFDKSGISSIYTSTVPWWINFLKKGDIYCVNKFTSTLRP